MSAEAWAILGVNVAAGIFWAGVFYSKLSGIDKRLTRLETLIDRKVKL